MARTVQIDEQIYHGHPAPTVNANWEGSRFLLDLQLSERPRARC